MQTLSRELRRVLENTVRKARQVAEAGARAALQQLTVGEKDAGGHLSAAQKGLRNRLRAHARQLGDPRDQQKGTQAIGRLVAECAYEHWHRLLFARFLAETELLIEPESGQAISLGECQELARSKNADWLELAAQYAQRMLPQIFRTGDPALEIALPPETRSALEDLMKGLPSEVFTAEDSLGWVYQYWQADRKEEVNRSEKKIGADELPAVTQLFTEDYMVLFLLHNTLGAWWAGKVLARNPALAKSAASEDELRTACAVGDIQWTYLRFVREGDGPWRPAAGTFAGWPKAAKDISVLDPCMGSGHFLVFALPILAAMRRAEESLSAETAVEAVLRDNLFGLEIDPRCTQIAAFNLALAAWRRVGYRQLPPLHLACSGLALGVTKAEWFRLAAKVVRAVDPEARADLFGIERNLFTAGLEDRVKNGLEALYDLFARAPTLGSLIDPHGIGADLLQESFAKLQPLFTSILSSADNDETWEMAVAAQGMTKAAELLGRRFTLTVTNVPFLGNRRQSSELLEFCKRFFDRSKIDLSVTMLDRLTSSNQALTVAAISPQAWLQQIRYRDFLEGVMFPRPIHIVFRYGAGAFQTISGEVVSVCAAIVSAEGTTASTIPVLDLSDIQGPSAKAEASISSPMVEVQTAQMRRRRTFLFENLEEHPPIGSIAFGTQGIKTGDDDRFVAHFWELDRLQRPWRPYIGTASSSAYYTGRTGVLRWENDGEGLIRARRDNAAFDHAGVAVNQMGETLAFIYTGEAFDSNVAPIICRDETDTLPLLAFLRSPSFVSELRKLEGGMKINNGTILRVPFDREHWQWTVQQQYLHGLPKPYANDPTQWLFDGHILGSGDPNILDEANRPSRPGQADHVLQVAVARLVGYRWPRQTGSGFLDCPPVGQDAFERHADRDGIVTLSPVKGEQSAESRLSALLADAFAGQWSAAKLAHLLSDAGFEGRTLDAWVRDGFFEQHCELFQQRPFVWHIWDGRRDGFNALVNCHRLAAPNGEGRRTLEKLLYTYLGDWTDRQRVDQRAGVEGADARVAAAEQLKTELGNILAGEPPYDIFVRWKPLAQQPIGWEPDVNDGVRMNIRPFMMAKPMNARAKGACILRVVPKIKWDKDRGKEPKRSKAEYPWFWGWDEATEDFMGGQTFDGVRWNDLHYSVAAKNRARGR